MIDPDTSDSVQAETASGQDPATAEYGDGADAARAAAPDPQQVKTDGDDSTAAKDPQAWVTGDEPMTGPQASYLETLAQQAGEQPPGKLTKAEASQKIEELRERAGR